MREIIAGKSTHVKGEGQEACVKHISTKRKTRKSNDEKIGLYSITP